MSRFSFFELIFSPQFQGNGSYIHIETSLPRKYNERAWLVSPWIRGAKRMTFFYSMYGDTIESLSVLVRSRVNGSASRVWSRYGNLKTSNWTEGCIAFNYSGNYQVGFELVHACSSKFQYSTLNTKTQSNLLIKTYWSPPRIRRYKLTHVYQNHIIQYNTEHTTTAKVVC